MGPSYLIPAVLIAPGFAGVLLFAVPETPLLIFLIIAAGVVALFWLFWFFGDYLPLRRFGPLKERFSFTEGADFREPLGRDAEEKRPDILTGVWGGCRVQIQYESASRHHPPSLSIYLLHDWAAAPVVSFHRESLFHRLVKSIGLSREAETEDPAFNARVYAESESDETLGPLISSPELRSAVLSLLEIRRTTVSIGPDAVGIRIRGHFGWPKYFKPDKIGQILERLSAVSKNSRTPFQKNSPPRREEPAILAFEGRTFRERVALLRHPARLAIFVASLLFFLGPALLAWGILYQTVTWRLHIIGLSLAAAALAFYTPLVFSFVRGRSRSHRQFGAFMFTALVGFPTLGIGALKVVNGLFDARPPFVVEGQFVNRARKGARVQIRVALPARSGVVSMRVSPSLYRDAKPGQFLRILLSPGALGEPWVIGAINDKTDGPGGQG